MGGGNFAHFLRLEEFQLATLHSLGCSNIEVFGNGSVFFRLDLLTAIEEIGITELCDMAFRIEVFRRLEVLEVAEPQLQQFDEDVLLYSALASRNQAVLMNVQADGHYRTLKCIRNVFYRHQPEVLSEERDILLSPALMFGLCNSFNIHPLL